MEHKIDTRGISVELLSLLPKKEDDKNKDKVKLELALLLFKIYLTLTYNTAEGLQSKLRYRDLIFDRALYSYICRNYYDIPTRIIGIVLDKNSSAVNKTIRTIFNSTDWLKEANLKYDLIKEKLNQL